MTPRRTLATFTFSCLLIGAGAVGAQPVVLFDACRATPQPLAGGWLDRGSGSGLSGSLEVLSVPEATATDGCLRARTEDRRVFALRPIRSQVEAGLALFVAEPTAPSKEVTMPFAPLAEQNIEVLSRASETHLLPWLDRGLEILAKDLGGSPLAGTPLVSADGRLVGLVSSQTLLTASPVGSSRLFVIPQEFARNWRSLLGAGKLPATGAGGASALRTAQSLPNGYKPGLVLDPRVASGADPMGINGELEAAAERSPHGPRALEILRALEERRVLGVFVKRDGIWFQVTPRSLIEIVDLLALEPVVVAALRPATPDPALVTFELDAQRVLRRLRETRSLELAYLADQVRVLALLAQTGEATIPADATSLLEPSSRWAPLWTGLRRQLPTEAARLETITRTLGTSSGARP